MGWLLLGAIYGLNEASLGDNVPQDGSRRC